jgi:hypothetical protein
MYTFFARASNSVFSLITTRSTPMVTRDRAQILVATVAAWSSWILLCGALAALAAGAGWLRAGYLWTMWSAPAVVRTQPCGGDARPSCSRIVHHHRVCGR